jgi:ABC-type hemin transport system ATPase subunit
MRAGSLVADAGPAHVLSQPEVLSTFEAPLSVISHPKNGVPQVLLDRNE